jgi:sarcosine oxidase / L-pipecolate oxidase
MSGGIPIMSTWYNDACQGLGISHTGSLYRSCVLVVGTGGKGSYSDDAYHNDVALGARIKALDTPAEIKSIFPPGAVISSFEDYAGYINYEGGWAFSSQGISLLVEKVMKLGGKIIPGKAVVELLKTEDGSTNGVKCADGSLYEADLVVIASGSWTPSTFPALDLYGKCLATGSVKLTEFNFMIERH